jgi:4-amino-4-deoxy-L-arabinose transferase-like glycosyltransferase
VASSFTLVVGLALLGLTAARVTAALGISSSTTFLVGAFVVAHAELLLVALGLSLVRGFTAGYLLLTLAALCAATLWWTRGVRSGIDWRASVRSLRGDPALVALGVVVALGLAYTFALAVGTQDVEDDVLTFHGVRAGLWHQHHGITYLAGIFDLRNNAYPLGGELGPFSTMTLAGNLHFVALDQFLAALAMIIGVAGIARRIGFAPRAAAFGGLLVATLPIVVLQAGTAMTDLIMPALAVAAVLLLFDRSRAAPWLAGVATALAVDVKLSVVPAIPLLLAFAWLARPAGLRRARVFAVIAGTVVGAFWYVVNLAETRAWDGHVTAPIHVDRSIPAVTARVTRLAIEFIDLSGAQGRDRWLYAVASLIVLAVATAIFVRRRRRDLVTTAALAAVLALVPIVLLPIEHRLIRGYFKTWDLLGRRDLADLDSGRDMTRSASNFSWFGPLGSVLFVGAGVAVVFAIRRGRLDRRALACVLAPVYWLVAYSVVFYYQDWVGRFFILPMALAAATWGIALRWRPAAWGIIAVAATSLLLALANDDKRPSGLPLLERSKPRSIWTTPRWTGVALRNDYDAPIRFLDTKLPESAAVGLAITPSEPVYPFFGTELGHRISFVYENDRDAPRADWVFVRPGRRISLCDAWRIEVTTADGWHILHRAPGRTCS